MYRFLYNCVFCLAFINFLIYWIYLFFDEKINNNYFALAIPAIVSGKSKQWNGNQNDLSKARRFVDSLTTRKSLTIFPFIISSSLWFVLTLLIFFRIIQSNHFPLANFYEALIFLTWCLVTLNFIILLEPVNTSVFPILSFYKKQNLSEKKQPTNFSLQAQPVNLLQSNSNWEKPQLKSWSETQWNKNQFSVQKQVSGAILAPIILFIIAFAQLYLEETITPLVPALKSNWLLMHVSIMICSYTTFMVGGLLAFFLLMQTFYSSIISMFKMSGEKYKHNHKIQAPSVGFTQAPSNVLLHYLQDSPNIYSESYSSTSTSTMEWYSNKAVKKNNENSYNYNSAYPFPVVEKQDKNSSIQTESFNNNNFGFPSFEHILEKPYKMQKKNYYILLDNLSYRMMGIGFPLFTLGILSGAVWANEAWGSYWSWDIKEVGSFINWLLVALYFHCRYKNFIYLSHMVAFISLMVLFFNFFGISLGIFGSSLHAYGAAS